MTTTSDSSGLLDRLATERPRAKSLIVTVYGDSLLPHGGTCWLGELIDLVAPLGLNERVTRTAVFRLVQDGILEAERIGRRSRYTLTRIGRRQFDSAQARIYASEAPARDGQWTLIALPDSVSAAERDSLVRELGWQGFARLAPGLLGAARGDGAADAMTVLTEMDAAEDCVVFTAEAKTLDALPGLAMRAWPLEELSQDYAAFHASFQPIAAEAASLAPEAAFTARTLLIHAYRRALLRDPALPDHLLPADWPGHAARELAATLYRTLSPGAEAHLAAIVSGCTSRDTALVRFA